jgi:hypothetical protein
MLAAMFSQIDTSQRDTAFFGTFQRNTKTAATISEFNLPVFVEAYLANQVPEVICWIEERMRWQRAD